MKYLFLLFALFTIYIYGCGDDNTTNTNNNGNGETVIFSMDSLSIYLTSSIQAKDTNINITNAPNVKITFQCLTNTDSLFSFASFKISAIDSSNIYLDSINNNISTLNNTHSISINASTNFYLNILIQINRNNSNPYYLKLNNIKIVRL